MTDKEALEFLELYQPMPSDTVLNEKMSILDTYEQVRKHFLINKNEECIPLFLNSFGDIDGFGVYQLVEDVIVKFDASIVLPHLAIALKSPIYSVKYWCAQIAALFPDFSLIEPLKSCFVNASFDLKYNAIVALGNIDDIEAKTFLINTLNEESDEELLDLLKSVLS